MTRAEVSRDSKATKAYGLEMGPKCGGVYISPKETGALGPGPHPEPEHHALWVKQAPGPLHKATMRACMGTRPKETPCFSN